MDRNQLTFGEYECYGPGADKSGRVSWVHDFGSTEVEQLTSMSFIDSADWLYTTPFQGF